MARAVDVISSAMKGKPRPTPDEDNDTNVEFSIPDGLKLPSSAKNDGDEFTVVATLQLSDGGTMLTLTKVDGIPVGEGEEAEGEQSDEDADKNVASMIKEGVSGRGEGQ